MGLKELYHGAEDAYYGFLDTLDRHGIPVYSVVDAIEAQNIPSFPIAVFALLLVVGGLFAFLGPSLSGNGTLSVLIQDETQNPIEGITVKLSGDNLPSSATSGRITDSSGKVVFTNLPVGVAVQISAQSDDYTINGKGVVIDQGENNTALAALAKVVQQSVTLQLYKPNSTESYTQPLSLSFSCSANSGFAQTSTVSNGVVSFDVPSDCGALSATSNDPTVTLQNTIIDLDDYNPVLYVSAQQTGNGILRVSLIDEVGNPISGIVVALKSKFGDQLAQKFTEGGIAEFSGLVPDTYAVFIPSDGTHAELDSGPFEVDEGAPVNKTYTLQNASVGEVRVQLVDESSLSPVASAKATLFKGNQLISTKTSNEGGQVTFAVSSSNNLTLSIDHAAHLIKSGVPISVSSAGYTQIGMTKATPQNSQIVTVKVVDELGLPVENAYVALKKSPSGASVGPNKITGTSGTVVFISLEEGTYFASAYKPGFSDQLRSDVFTVKARENIETTVKLVLGTGTVALTILGSDGQPLAGATVQPIDGITHEDFGTDFTSGVDGKVELTLRADKYAYFHITEPNHLPYTTIPVQLKKGITQNLQIELVKDIQKLEVKLLGLFVNGEPILDEAGLAPGQLYTIRMGLFVPKNSTFNEGGIHIRTGNAQEGQSNPVENDDWFIRGVRGPYSKLQKGTTYSPPLGLGADTQHLTSGDAKWANVIMTPIDDGVTQIEVDVQVKDTAVQGSDLPLYYRAWGKTGSYVRFPVDAVLGGSESTGQKQGLYANTNLQLFSIGAGTHFCSQDFCLGLVAEDLANGLQTDLTDDYQVDVSTKHKLLFTFTSISDNVLADTSIILKSTSGSANLSQYDITNAVGAKKTGVVTGNKAEIQLGVIQTNNVVFGFVNFDTQKEGNAKVTMSMVSNKKELFTKDILIKVDAAGEMNVEVVPKAILPLLVNQLLIHVTETGEDIPLENAGVSISLNDTLLTSGFTDVEGVFPFELHEPNVGDKVDILIEKPGFKPIVLTITVGSDILTFIPSSISETLVVNGTTKKTRDVHMLNLASIPLVVKEVSLSGGFDDLVKFDLLNEEILDATLPVNGDMNMSFALSLTEKGQSLLVGKNFKGAVLVKLSSEQNGKTFVGSLPLNLKIGFGGEVDVEDCLLLQPTQWDVFTNTQTLKQLAFEVKNTCTVQGNPVSLANLSVKVKQLAGDSIGTFTAVASDKTVTLGPDFKTVLSIIPAAGEAIVTVTFDPAQIKSGSASPQLVFQATNLTDSGIPDLLSETAVVNVAVNNLKQCIQVKTPNLLEIDSCAINAGFGVQGNYNNQVYRPTGVPYYNPSYSTLNKTTNPSGTSLLPSNQSGLYQPQVGAGGYDGLGYQNQGINQQLFSPINGYNTLNGYYGNQYVDPYNSLGGAFGQFGCGGTEIRVENSCQTDVEIELDVDPNLQTNTAAFVLKPNEDQRVRVSSGYRIGRYDIAVNARTKGSSDASKEIELVRVLVKSPTEVNADCIQLDKTKFRFNDFIQKPVKAKAINKCYDQGVRLVESADTITIASFFNVDGALSTDGTGTEAKKNTLVHDIQIIGMQTRGVGNDTYQEIEFQIFPDLSTYKSQPDLFLDEGGVGKRFSDLKLFAEANYYRVESYGTISVKFLDAYGGAQQKPFAVIFENIFSLASAIDALLQGGSTKITNFQECVNEEALQNLSFGDESFLDGTTITYTTKDPGSVLLTGREKCGTSDTLGEITAPLVMNGKEDPLVQATFRRVGKHDVQVTIVRPKNVQGDVTLEGTLSTTIKRVYVNPGTQNVKVKVKITVLKPGKTTNIAAFQPLACGYGYEKAGSFISKYGFDALGWYTPSADVQSRWTLDNSPDCEDYYCDTTQLMIHTLRKVRKLNDFVEKNRNAGVFTSSSTDYTTKDFITQILDKTTLKVYDFDQGNDIEKTFYLATDGGVLTARDPAPNAEIEKMFVNVKELPDDKTNYLEYINTVEGHFNSIKADYPKEYANTLILFNKAALEDNTKLIGGKTIIQLMQDFDLKLDVFKTDNTKYYAWSLSEYHHFHTELIESFKSGTATLNFQPALVGSTSPISWVDNSSQTMTITGVDSATVAVSGVAYTIDKTGRVTTPANVLVGQLVNVGGVFSVRIAVSPDLVLSEDQRKLLRTLASSVDSVRVGYVVPAGNVLMDDAERDYLVENAKKQGQFSWGDFEDAETFVDEIFDAKVKLVKDNWPATFKDDFLAVSGPYYYSERLQKEWMIEPSIVKVMKTSLATLAEPGQYTILIDATWDGSKGKVKAFGLTLTNKDARTLADLQPQGAEYAKNPFFYLPLNGAVAKNKRAGYGSAFYIDEVTGKLVTSGTSTSEKKTLQEIASFSQANQNLPVLFKLTKGTGYSVETAPHVPIPLKLRYGGAQQNPSFQYTFTDNSGQPVVMPSNAITWYDCTSSLPNVVTPLAGASCNVSLSPGQSQSLRQNLPGEYFYTGMLLLPPAATGNQYGILPLCANTEGDLKTVKNIVSTSNTASSQIQSILLDETYAVPAAQNIPQSLTALIQSIQDGRTCARMDSGNFSVIWDLATITPSTLTCNST